MLSLQHMNHHMLPLVCAAVYPITRVCYCHVHVCHHICLLCVAQSGVSVEIKTLSSAVIAAYVRVHIPEHVFEVHVLLMYVGDAFAQLHSCSQCELVWQVCQRHDEPLLLTSLA